MKWGEVGMEWHRRELFSDTCALAEIPETIASSSDQLKLGRNLRQSLDVSEAHKKASYDDSDKFSTTSQASRFSSLSALRFHSHLTSSRVYRRVTRTESVMSFSTSALGSKAWSVFSGLSLSEVSVVSAIALPLISSDIDHPNHYEFGRIVVAESVSPGWPQTLRGRLNDPCFRNQFVDKYKNGYIS